MAGMGGDMASAESRRKYASGICSGTQTSNSHLLSLEIAKKLLARQKPTDVLFYLAKAMADGTNLDAYVTMAFICPTLDDSVECLEAGIRKGMPVWSPPRVMTTEEIEFLYLGRAALKRKLGVDVFDDSSKYAGKFWGLLETRPYMRILQAMVRIAFTNKQYSKSA